MEHRYEQRYAACRATVIYRHGLPVAIGAIRNFSKAGVFIETTYEPGEDEHALELEYSCSTSHGAQRHRVRGLIIRRTDNGLGLLIEDPAFAASTLSWADAGISRPVPSGQGRANGQPLSG